MSLWWVRIDIVIKRPPLLGNASNYKHIPAYTSAASYIYMATCNFCHIHLQKCLLDLTKIFVNNINFGNKCTSNIAYMPFHS